MTSAKIVNELFDRLSEIVDNMKIKNKDMEVKFLNRLKIMKIIKIIYLTTNQNQKELSNNLRKSKEL